jgi:Ca2+/H+ antiporter
LTLCFSTQERNLCLVTFKSLVIAIPFVMVFALGLWLQLRRSWGRPSDQVERPTRLAEEIHPEDWRESRRERYRNLFACGT